MCYLFGQFIKRILNLHLDPSDTDLRHALANMIAVVFALPSCSNHIWYHMFCPGELENTFLTGFMVMNFCQALNNLCLNVVSFQSQKRWFNVRLWM